MKFKVTVEFIVDAESWGPWTVEEVALDHIRHVIDEGYNFEEVKSWDFVDFRPCEGIVDPQVVS